MTSDALKATANGEELGECKKNEMSKFWGFASMQHQAVRTPAGHECLTLERNSKTPSSGMAYKQITYQTIRIPHQSPTHFAGFHCHWLYILLIHSVYAWTKVFVFWVKVIRATCGRLNESCVDSSLHFFSQEI